MALGVAASLLKPWPVALIIDHLTGSPHATGWLTGSLQNRGTPFLIAAAAAAIFLLHAAQGVFSAGQNFLSIKAGLGGLARIRAELFDRMQRLSLAFYQRRNQGDLIYRATWDTYAFQTIFQQGLFKFINALATVLLMLVVLWRLNLSLTLMTLAVFPPLIAVMYFFGRGMNRRGLAAHQADSKVTSLVQQNIASLPLVQSYAQEAREGAAFQAQIDESRRKRASQHGLEVLYWLVIAVLFGLATAVLTWWGAREIQASRLSVGELVIFLAYLGQLYEPLNQLSHVGATVSDANAGTQRIFEILDAREEVPESLAGGPFPKTSGVGARVEFSGVEFGYDPKTPVLSELSFKIEAGETIGLVGPSGAGKTTILNLLPRFYDPDRGAILIQGVEAKTIRLRELRLQIATVFQESHLLPGTIAENIAYGRAGASTAEIEEAARLANAAEFIARLPQGYGTFVGDGGARLSVGEKQRINIARAFLKNAPILLLDEPTSALDAETEASVIESLERLISSRTTIMAAHRLSTLRQAHRILVLESGRIAESGSPAELLRSDGYYARAIRQISRAVQPPVR